MDRKQMQKERKLESFSSPPLLTPRRSVDPAQLRSKAEELAKLAQSVVPEVEQTQKGLLPKELIPKLRRIEKLCKQLRNELTP